MTTPEDNHAEVFEALTRQIEDLDGGTTTASAGSGAPLSPEALAQAQEQYRRIAEKDPLAVIILAVRSNALPQHAIIPAFLGTRFTVPGRAENDDVASFKPLVLTNEDKPYVPAYTDPEILGDATDDAPARISATGRDLILNVTEGFGIVLNPGTALNTEFPATLIDALRTDLRNNVI